MQVHASMTPVHSAIGSTGGVDAFRVENEIHAVWQGSTGDLSAFSVTSDN